VKVSRAVMPSACECRTERSAALLFRPLALFAPITAAAHFGVDPLAGFRAIPLVHDILGSPSIAAAARRFPLLPDVSPA
jgi:hypothetical protein